MKLALFGATGGTGRHLTDQALTAGHTVTALVRDPGRIQPRNRLNVLAGDGRDGAAVERAVAGQDAVVCALGGRPWRRRERVCSTAMPHIVAAMQRQSVRRIVALSTFGAGDTRPQVGLLTRLMVFGLILRSEVADKEAMEAQLAESDSLWTIVRVGVLSEEPGRGVYRARDDGTIQGMGTISRADVAHFILSELQASLWVRRRPVLVY